MKDIIKISKTLKLLYVEDDEESRVSTLEMLKNFFDDISVAVDGQEALEIFKENEFDLIISDINMPRLTGIEMLEEIRSFDTEIPVLIFSAYNEVRYFIETIKLGVDGYILKPLEFSQFILVLKKTSEKIKLKKEIAKRQKSLEEDVYERTKELYEKLHYDDLTGVLSRYSFFQDIQKIDTPIVFIIDIDKFKIINEVYTTTVGSQVLKEFARFLLEYVAGTTSKVYRLSSDEFTVLDRVNEEDIKNSKERINAFFKKLKNFRVELKNDSIVIDVTLGCAMLQDNVLDSANIALDFAKKSNLEYAIYTKEIDSREDQKNALIWRKEVKSAIDSDKVIPFYSPVVNSSSKVIHYETVIYIEDFCKEPHLPLDFLDFISKTKSYDKLLQIITFKAFKVLGSSDKILSFSFRDIDINNGIFLDKIELFFKNSKNLGKRAIFEIAKSSGKENYTRITKFIKRFRQYGIKIIINDFGTTLCDYQYILEIQPEYLKIDGFLVENIEKDIKSYSLVKAIVQFSHELDIKVIAQSVYNKKTFSMLRNIDVDEYQGDYFSKPLKSL